MVVIIIITEATLDHVEICYQKLFQFFKFFIYSISNSLILDNERWKQADVPSEFQELVDHISSSGNMTSLCFEQIKKPCECVWLYMTWADMSILLKLLLTLFEMVSCWKYPISVGGWQGNAVKGSFFPRRNLDPIFPWITTWRKLMGKKYL